MALAISSLVAASSWAQDTSESERATAPTATNSVPAAANGSRASSSITSTPRRTPDALPAGAIANLSLDLPEIERRAGDSASAVRIVLALSLLAILPSMLVCLTAFLRIVIVLSMLRHALGMPETPPNTVVIGLALFLTLFTMNPVLQQVNTEALQPFMAGKLGVQQGMDKAAKPLREFMVRQTREQDLALMVEISKSRRPDSIDDISNLQLIPAFMLSELRAAFQIGFVIFLPFLLIDLIVSSILMSLGMMMMPPVTIALPIKILMFVLVDGWSLIVKALVGSFH
ncbi:MAG TPA: flagellar type III secretion system pore protein FliP [Ideonella sp.]|uniref:flagellar type III secretion system pore protein FliP n=1 Tax=Ideonella sp. TaxID=1929293 RepID=UPI002E2F75DE|nr:flagellar type III secretion system pore protein FliP [Ideonella sp.]HEX5682660.1 flagellar type III secretion system pore protein FliP [Ideonella sp.]